MSLRTVPRLILFPNRQQIADGCQILQQPAEISPSLVQSINNPDFNPPEFGGIRMEAGTNRFYISVNKFVEKTGAIGIFSKAGRYGGTYAHKDIAYNELENRPLTHLE